MAIGRVNTGGGGTGATLVITGVAGDTCTITKDGKSKSKMFDSSGKATFKGLDTGTWTVTMTNASGDTATRTVTVNADYTLTISYFSATISVTYPEGSTCTCSDGNTTLTAPDTSGAYTFTVGNTGTWTVTCTNGDDTASQDVSITAEGQSESVALNYLRILYNAGDECASTTGGWSGKTTGSASFEKESKYLNLYSGDEENSGTAWAFTQKKIYFPQRATLKVTVSGSYEVGDCKFGIGDSNSTFIAYKTITGKGTFSLSFDGTAGEYYVLITHKSTSENWQGYIEVSKVWTE